MNKPNYSPEEIELRVASMEEDCWQMLEEEADVAKQGKHRYAYMTATIIPEVAYLFKKLCDKRKANGTEGESLVNKPLKEIEGRLKEWEKNRGAIRAGRFIRLPVCIIRDMRYLLDGLGVEASDAKHDDDPLWEEAMATGIS